MSPAARTLGLAAGLAAGLVLFGAARAQAGALSPADEADLRRAYAAAALSSSEEPAVREERRLREPSTGFMLGAALGAWTAARDQLDYDLKNPQAAGAAHASQGPANLEAIDQDCREEKVAFERLTARADALAIAPTAVLKAAGVVDAALLEVWRSRSGQGPAAACR